MLVPLKEYEERYMISPDSEIMYFDAEDKSTVVKQYVNKSGYMIVSLKKGGEYKTWNVHGLMASTFYDHKPDRHKLVIDHINGVKSDNRIENLQILTHKENIIKYHRVDKYL